MQHIKIKTKTFNYSAPNDGINIKTYNLGDIVEVDDNTAEQLIARDEAEAAEGKKESPAKLENGKPTAAGKAAEKEAKQKLETKEEKLESKPTAADKIEAK